MIEKRENEYTVKFIIPDFSRSELITIYKPTHDFMSHPITQINWSAIGGVNIGIASMFHEALGQAIEEAKRIQKEFEVSK